MKRIAPSLATAALLMLAASGDSIVAGTVSGHVMGADGKPPVAADVHIFTPGGRIGMKPLKSVSVGRDGSFKLDLPEGEFFTLIATGADHDFASVALPAPKGKENIGLDISLPRLPYTSTVNGVKIIGSWNNFSFDSPAEMQRLPDGSYLYEVDAPGEKEVSYQLLGVVGEGDGRFGRSVNGPVGASYIYDGGGDYRTVVPVKNGRARITFSPTSLPRSGSTEAKFVYDKKHDWANRIVAFGRVSAAVEAVEKERRAALAAVMARSVEGNTPLDTKALKEIVERFRPRIAEAMTPLVNGLNDPNPTVQMFAAIGLADQPELDPAMVDRINRVLPVESEGWAIDPGAKWRLNNWLQKLEKSSVAELQENGWRTSAFRSLSTNIIALMISLPADKREPGEVMAGKLIETFPDEVAAAENGDVSHTIRAMNPNRAIKVGKTVPDFNVTLMDGSTASRASMMGKTYMIDFWAVWCGPCRAELPGLHAAYDKYKARGLEVLSLSFDEKPADVTKFRKSPKTPMPWLHSFVENGFKSDLATAFEVEAIPKPILVGPDGKIIAVEGSLRGADLEQTLKRALPTDRAGR